MTLQPLLDTSLAKQLYQPSMFLNYSCCCCYFHHYCDLPPFLCFLFSLCFLMSSFWNPVLQTLFFVLESFLLLCFLVYSLCLVFCSRESLLFGQCCLIYWGLTRTEGWPGQTILKPGSNRHTRPLIIGDAFYLTATFSSLFDYQCLDKIASHLAQRLWALALHGPFGFVLVKSRY